LFSWKFQCSHPGGDQNIVYYHSHWDVADDEALLIEAMPLERGHWNFQLNKYWMESLDYRDHTNLSLILNSEPARLRRN